MHKMGAYLIVSFLPSTSSLPLLIYVFQNCLSLQTMFSSMGTFDNKLCSAGSMGLYSIYTPNGATGQRWCNEGRVMGAATLGPDLGWAEKKQQLHW